MGKPPSFFRPKPYAVPTLPNSTAFPKVGETNDLSNPVTSNSVPSSRESTVVNNERVIAPGIFRINPFKANRVDNFVPKQTCKKNSVRQPIIVSQPPDDVCDKLESLFGYLFDELSNGENQVVSQSSAVTTADASDKCQQQQDSTSSTSTLATTITADGNFDL
ncbi:hypothetical protein Tco_1079058 [Tanacetum coccineum]|uniref:Uncharacterized protein n=1 Tax=Tanacetum coccineum TaxID=301880 RepID=A0ABQ5HQQ6_9ASTR